MQPNNEDTPAYESPEMLEILSKLSLDERAKRFFDLWNFAREMQWTGIQIRNPLMSDLEVTQEFKRIMYDYYSKETSQKNSE